MENTENSRRDFIKKTALVTLGTLAVSNIPASVFKMVEPTGDFPPFELPKLGFEYSALEPHIDAQTMTIHYSKHHQAYVDKLNKALAENNVMGIKLVDIVKNISKYPAAVRNNGGGHYNHSLFWTLLTPNTIVPSGTLAEAIKTSFGSLDEFKTKFFDSAKAVFGSGWTWLVVNADKKLEIGNTPNQDNPLMDISTFKGTPVLALDVWEHAYYLKHQNIRADYLADWWKVVNWSKAEELYVSAMK